MLANAPAVTPQGISRAGAAFLRDPESTSYVAELGGLAVFRIPAYGSPSPPRGEHHEAPMVLVQQYYLDADAVRRRENRECLERNAANPCIDRIILLNERLYSEEELGVPSDKI